MNKKNSVLMLPAFMVLCILPFCIRLHIINIDLSQYPWFPNQNIWGDFFLYQRSKLVIGIAVLAILVLLDAFILQRKKIEIHRKWFLFLGYIGFCILSVICSENREIALHGGMEHFEGLWVLLSYVVICFYGYYLAKSRENCGFLFQFVLVTSFLMGILGISQMMGKDILQMDGILSLVIPKEFEEYRDWISFNFPNENMNLVYMSLYNPNYVGSFVALCFPILIGGFREAKHKIKKIGIVVTYVLLMISLVGSQSKTGILICVFIHALMLFQWISTKQKDKNVEKNIGIKSVIVISLLVFAVGSVFLVVGTKKELHTSFEDISLDGKGIEVRYNNSFLGIDYRLEKEQVIPVFIDQSGSEPACEYDVSKEEYLIQVENLTELRIGCYEMDGIVHIYLRDQENEWLFVDENGNHQMSYVTIYGKTDQLVEAPSVFPKSFDSLFTYRGYIWGRTIPLLKDKLLWGSGPDTFIYEFPQNDYVSRSHGEQGFFREILTKPHSMYLQMAVQTGVGSLVCFLIFVGHTIWNALVIMRKRISHSKKQRNITQKNVQQDKRMEILMYSVLGYLLVGIFNDSTVTVAPIFYLLCGLLAGYVECEDV